MYLRYQRKYKDDGWKEPDNLGLPDWLIIDPNPITCIFTMDLSGTGTLPHHITDILTFLLLAIFDDR